MRRGKTIPINNGKRKCGTKIQRAKSQCWAEREAREAEIM